jgi:hypothetical protein
MHKHRIADSLSSSARPPNIIDLMNFIIQEEVRNRTGDYRMTSAAKAPRPTIKDLLERQPNILWSF